MSDPSPHCDDANEPAVLWEGYAYNDEHNRIIAGEPGYVGPLVQRKAKSDGRWITPGGESYRASAIAAHLAHLLAAEKQRADTAERERDELREALLAVQPSVSCLRYANDDAGRNCINTGWIDSGYGCALCVHRQLHEIAAGKALGIGTTAAGETKGGGG